MSAQTAETPLANGHAKGGKFANSIGTVIPAAQAQVSGEATSKARPKKKAAKRATAAKPTQAARPPTPATTSPATTKAPIALRNYFGDQLQTFGLGSSREQWDSFIGALTAAGPTICGFT